MNIFWEFCKKHPGEVIFNCMFSILIPIQDVVLPHFYGNIISAIEKNQNIVKPIIIVLVVLVMIQIGYVLADWDDSELLPKIQTFIRESMLQTIFKNYESQYQELLIGDLISKFVKIPTYLIEWFERTKNFIVPYIISYIFATIYFTYTDIYLGVCLGTLLLIFVYLILGSPYFCKNLSIKKDVEQNNLHEEIDDTLRNLISVYGGDQQQEEINRLDTYEKNYAIAYKNTVKCSMTARAFIMPITVLFIVLFFYQCTNRINDKTLTTAKFISLFIILLYVLNSIMILTDQVRDMIFEYGIINNFEEEILDIKNHKNKNYNVSDIPEQGIYLHNVSYKYPESNTLILSNINLYINKGERVCIIGEIGSGKSTILKLLIKLNNPTDGTIFLNGIPYPDISLKDIRKKIGYVPQQPVLFNRSILDNIKYSNLDISNETIISLLHELNLMEAFSNLENGLDTKIGKNGSKISGGQRQLIWSLRILLHEPEILVLDEPTASLDEKTKNLLIRLYDHFMGNKTIIMVTHDQTLMKYARRTIVLDSGKIVKDYSNSRY
jgi:ABC-type multidrug transport system fused ATPase/permease subunit